MTTHTRDDITIRFAGDSGDGMQLAGLQFTSSSARAGNDISTLPDFPSEIRAPQGTTYGVSAFQIRFGSVHVATPGDECDVLVAMNAASLKVNLKKVKAGGMIIANAAGFDSKSLQLAGYSESPLADGSLSAWQVFAIDITGLTRRAIAGITTQAKQVERSKNFFALGLAYWLFSRPLEPTLSWIEDKFHEKNDVIAANSEALRAGWAFGDTAELFPARYEVHAAALPPGEYRNLTGNEGIAFGLAAAANAARIPLVLGSYPITPASDILHSLAKLKHLGVRTIQAEDEIAGIASAIGASYGGALGVTTTSGPGLALKTEALGLAVMTELPLVVVDVQRAGPSTGIPTKTEQSDLLQALYGRNGDAPVAVVAPATPADCFRMAYQAARMALRAMAPVIVLSDGYLGNGTEPWRIDELSELPPIDLHFAAPSEDPFMPYAREEQTLARPWAIPGTPGLEHRIGGLEKHDVTGEVSSDPDNHQVMTRLRREKIERLADIVPPAEVEGSPSGDLLVISWGSTYGALRQAVEVLCDEGYSVGLLHLRYLYPMPANTAELIARFGAVVVAELNAGQLVRVVRDAFLVDAGSIAKVQGQPFKTSEAIEQIRQYLP